MRKNKLKTHKDLDVWKKAVELAENVYWMTARFPKEEVYGLSMQTRRSAVSIPSNIAEGAARNSKKEFIQFLHVALGSAAELETQLILATRIGFLRDRNVFDLVNQVRSMLLGLLRFLRRPPALHHSSRVTHHE